MRSFHAQFTRAFQDEATRHVVFRHLPTQLNQGRGDARVFQGRVDPPIEGFSAAACERLISSVKELRPRRLLASPLRRAVATLEHSRRIGRLRGGHTSATTDFWKSTTVRARG